MTKFEHIVNKVLAETMYVTAKSTPITKTVIKSKCIDGVKPLDLYAFMVENNIPETAYFDVIQDGEGYATSCPQSVLCWEEKAPTTEKEQQIRNERRFENLVFPALHKAFYGTEFVRQYPYPSKYKPFQDKSIYQRYIDKDMTTLYNYFSLFWAND